MGFRERTLDLSNDFRKRKLETEKMNSARFGKQTEDSGKSLSASKCLAPEPFETNQSLIRV